SPVLHLMDLPEMDVDRDAALLPGPGLAHERHDSAITHIDLALDLKGPVVELLGPHTYELDPALAATPDRSSLERHRDQLEIVGGAFQIEGGTGIASLHPRPKCFDHLAHNLHVLPRHRPRSISPKREQRGSGRREKRRLDSDVVHPRAGLLGLAAGDVRDRGLAEGGAERLHPLLPDAARLLALLADHAVEPPDDP